MRYQSPGNTKWGIDHIVEIYVLVHCWVYTIESPILMEIQIPPDNEENGKHLLHHIIEDYSNYPFLGACA
jgi:hypothetical protein